MKKNRKYLLVALLLLAALLLYWVKESKFAPKSKNEISDTVLAEDEAMNAGFNNDNNLQEVLSSSTDATVAAKNSDVKAVVLFESDSNNKNELTEMSSNRILAGLRTIKTEPRAEFEKLTRFVTKPMESIVSSTEADGTEVINVGSNLEEAANITQYYMNIEKDVKFYLHFDYDSGQMTARSCSNIKNEIFQHEQLNSWEMRYDRSDYVTFMADDKYYLRLKYSATDMSYSGLLFKNGPNGWEEIQEIELIARKLESSNRFDPRSCRLGD